MSASISSLLTKAAALTSEAIRAQPADPFASFSIEQRYFYEQWWDRFKAQHSEWPDALYEAAINYTKWTPNDWLAYPRISEGMTMTDVQSIYFEYLGKKQ
jgi:hypothetical protein